jgi:hypothetical protein
MLKALDKVHRVLAAQEGVLSSAAEEWEVVAVGEHVSESS